MDVIIYTQDNGVAAVIIPTTTVANALKDVPASVGAAYEVVDDSVIPSDRTFRGAWERSGATVVHDLTKCKEIAHELRLSKREEEFAPINIDIDDPADSHGATRTALRSKYSTMETDIDSALTEGAIKTILTDGGVLA